jgi:hypothetical protein
LERTVRSENKRMKRASLSVRVLLVGYLAVSLSGCAAALVGVGAAGGYAISKDSVKDYFDLPQETVFQQSLLVAKEMGTVESQNEDEGLINAKIRGASVTIKVKPISKKTVELKIRARDKVLIPKVGIAQDVYNEIAERL